MTRSKSPMRSLSLTGQMTHAFQQLPTCHPLLIRKMKQASGLRHLLIEKLAGLDNAYFLRPGGLSDREEEELTRVVCEHGSFFVRKDATALLTAHRSSQGGIFFGETHASPYTLSHELGHALAANAFSERLPAFLNRCFHVIAGVGIVLALVHGPILPPLAIGLVVLGALSTLAVAYTEGSASLKGLHLLQAVGYEITMPGRRALALAWCSYVWPRFGIQVLLPLGLAFTQS
jgi:hypothetical protein